MTLHIQVSVSDRSELRSLRELLGRAPDTRVEQTTGIPARGAQGAADALTVLASSGGALAVAIRALPAFIRSRRSDVAVTVKHGDSEWTVHATNVDDVMPIIERTLRADDVDG